MEKSSLVQQARVLVTEFTQKKKQKPSALARMLDISPSRITQLYNNPEMLSEEFLLKVINKLKPKTDFNLVSTSNFLTVQNICKEAQGKHRLVCVIGYPGAGKTIALDEYFRTHSNVFFIEVKKSMNRKQFLAHLVSAIGIGFQGTIFEMLEMIAYELNMLENPLLIIDEVGKLDQKSLLDLHDLRNATMVSTGVVLAGCEYFHTNIKAAVQRGKEGIPEFDSRIQSWYDLNLPTKKEIEAICKANDVSDAETIKEFQRLKNYRELSNAIFNETDESESIQP